MHSVHTPFYPHNVWYLPHICHCYHDTPWYHDTPRTLNYIISGKKKQCTMSTLFSTHTLFDICCVDSSESDLCCWKPPAPSSASSPIVFGNVLGCHGPDDINLLSRIRQFYPDPSPKVNFLKMFTHTHHHHQYQHHHSSSSALVAR